MVVNLDWWRQHDVTAHVVAHLRKYENTVFLWDQEGLNAVLVGTWGELDPRWNQIANVSGRSLLRDVFFPVEKLWISLSRKWCRVREYRINRELAERFLHGSH